MTDHPMECYPGHFEPWKPGEMVSIPTLAQQINIRESGMPAETWSYFADEAISRAMSGQITSSTGDQDAR